MVKEKEKNDKPYNVILKAGSCDIVVDTDEKGRPTLTPSCPADDKGTPKFSSELELLNEVLRSEEVVLKPAKVKQTEG